MGPHTTQLLRCMFKVLWYLLNVFPLVPSNRICWKHTVMCNILTDSKRPAGRRVKFKKKKPI